MFILKNLNTSEKIIKNLQIPLLAFLIFPFLLLIWSLDINIGLIIALDIACCAAAAVLFFLLGLDKVMLTNSVLGYVMTAGLSVLIFIWCFFSFKSLSVSVAAALIFFNCLNILLSLFFRYGCDGRLHFKNLAFSAFGAAALAFTLFIYLPSDSFINNLKNFDFAYQDFIFFMFIPFFAVILIAEAISLLLNEKFLNLYLSLLAGINLCIFIQCTFLNSNLGLLDGEAMKWEDYTDFSVISSVILLVYLALPFVLQFISRKLWKIIVKKIPLFVGLIEGVSLIILAIASNGEMFERNTLFLSGDEQYTVSSKKNIITIVLDATDNEYIKAALKDKPEIFEGYEDFTVYTNTCSFFDSTFQSFTQIFSGYEELPIYEVDKWNHDAWSCESGIEFFKRFHDANYKMNFFVDASWDLSLLEGRIDNIKSSSVKNSVTAYMGVVNDFSRLTAYRAMPFALKRFFTVDDLDINRNFSRGGSFNFYNDDFERDIETMELADSSKNYFVVEHTWGAHTPFDRDNFMDTAEYLFDMVGKYLDNLKKFGVYDNSTIVIMADHGSHNITQYPNSTPLFMIKEAGRTSDRLTLNDAPIYFTDLMATYLTNAGLFDGEKDRELFGSPIYDFEEGEQRERVAHYRVNDDRYPPSKVSPLVPSFGYNVIYSYKYTGDSEDLLKETQKGPYRIDHMEEDAS